MDIRISCCLMVTDHAALLRGQNYGKDMQKEIDKRLVIKILQQCVKKLNSYFFKISKHVYKMIRKIPGPFIRQS